MNIKNKIVFVSGGNRGIGRSLVEKLIIRGAKKIYLAARNHSAVEDILKEHEDKIVPITLDLTQDETISNAAAIASDTDILINNAGVLVPGGFLDGGMLNSLKTNLDVNMWGTVKLIQEMLGGLQKQDSAAIVSVSSVLGLANGPMVPAYSISKAALHSVIQGLRAELKNSNILVSGVYPGPVETDMTKGFDMEMASPESVAKNILDGIENGSEDIFPDAVSQYFGKTYQGSPKEAEIQMSSFGK